MTSHFTIPRLHCAGELPNANSRCRFGAFSRSSLPFPFSRAIIALPIPQIFIPASTASLRASLRHPPLPSRPLSSSLSRAYSTLADLPAPRAQIVTHSATFDFFPHVRHALRATPHGERPLSVAEYEAQAGKAARDWQQDEWAKLGVEARPTPSANRPRGYND